MILTSYALALGFVHGLGADHLMAIAALSVRAPGDLTERAHPVRVAIGFAIGHALLLLVGSAAVVLLGWHAMVRVRVVRESGRVLIEQEDDQTIAGRRELRRFTMRVLTALGRYPGPRIDLV